MAVIDILNSDQKILSINLLVNYDIQSNRTVVRDVPNILNHFKFPRILSSCAISENKVYLRLAASVMLATSENMVGSKYLPPSGWI